MLKAKTLAAGLSLATGLAGCAANDSGGSQSSAGSGNVGTQGGAAPSAGFTSVPGAGSPGTGGSVSVGGSSSSAGAPSTAGGPGFGGASTTGGTSGTAGAPGVGGLAGAGGSSSTGCTPNPTAQACSGTAAPTDGVVIDFATYVASGAWGTAAQGDLTGGTSPYGTPAITRTVENGGLRLQVMLAPMGYSGFVLWFGPCVNASAYGGVSFTAGGSLGGAALKVQVQTHVDYPVDVANTKGACLFTNCDTRFSECVGPTATVAVPATAGPIALPWSAFLNGKPTATVTAEGLVGLQFQLECASSTACAVDLTLGTINFMPL